jgi:uncharacterized repeat protein (TIGR03803 family)
MTRHSRRATIVSSLFFLCAGALAQPQFRVLHEFEAQGESAKYPNSLIRDAAGNLYGTTQGGFSKCSNGCGAVFELSPSGEGWTYKLVYGFKGYKFGDGSEPNGLAIDAAGNLYGTTYEGGGSYNVGTVFELTPNSSGGWSETILYVFTFGQGGNGYSPKAPPILDSKGNLYGTTQGGGELGCGCGTVWELSPPASGSGPWTESVLWNFTDGFPDEGPEAPIIFDTQGNIYGVTQKKAFELMPSAGGWTEKALSQIVGGSAGLALDPQGNLYGTEEFTPEDFGSAYELSPGDDGSWTYTDIWDFNPVANPGDGAFPAAPISVINDGVLLGATTAGGHGFNLDGCWELDFCGDGTIFRMTKNSSGTWEETSRFPFYGAVTSGPPAALVLDSSGNIYGVAGGGKGVGLIFELTPAMP